MCVSFSNGAGILHFCVIVFFSEGELIGKVFREIYTPGGRGVFLISAKIKARFVVFAFDWARSGPQRFGSSFARRIAAAAVEGESRRLSGERETRIHATHCAFSVSPSR